MADELTRMVPKEALDYLTRKELKPAFSYRDVWNEEHASAFTVAKAMQVDVLKDIKTAIEQAVEKGQTFDTFRKNLRPTLEEKGWWGKKKMTDPVTGETRDAQLGSDRRLKVIYDTNLGQARAAGREERGMASTSHPYAMYNLGPSKHHREAHAAWGGIVLPKEDAWWDTHSPKNGWGCKCYKTFISQARYERLKTDGYTVPPSLDGTGGGTKTIKTERPDEQYKTWVDTRTGRIERIPLGITPGFAWNPGQIGRAVPVLDQALTKTREHFAPQYDLLAKTLVKNQISETRHRDFVDQALARLIDKKHLSPVGFLPTKVLKYLEKSGVKPTSNVISLESGLLSNPKYNPVKGHHQNESPDISDWYRLPDFLLDAEIFEDKNDLIFLFRKPDEYVKIVVDPKPQKNRAAHGTSFQGPILSSMYRLEIDSQELVRILGLKKVR